VCTHRPFYYEVHGIVISVLTPCDTSQAPSVRIVVVKDETIPATLSMQQGDEM